MSPTERVKGQVSPTLIIAGLAPGLAPAERRVAEAIIAAPGEIAGLSIGLLAKRCGTSEATVVRFCKRVGFAGYPELRLALASESGRSAARGEPSRLVDLDIGPDDDLAELVAKVGAVDAQAIGETVAHLDLASLARVVDAIGRADRIELYGIGASGLVASDLEQKLRRIGIGAHASTDAHACLTSAALLTDRDLALGISHGGETLDVIDPIVIAGERGARTVAVTNYPQSGLAQAAEVVLVTAVRESAMRSGAIASRVAQLTVVDCIFTAVAVRRYDQTVKALEQTFHAVQSRRNPSRRSRS